MALLVNEGGKDGRKAHDVRSDVDLRGVFQSLVGVL